MEDVIKVSKSLSNVKVGEIVEVNMVKYKAILSSNGCTGCAFFSVKTPCHLHESCMASYRSDNKPAIFVCVGKKADISESDMLKTALLKEKKPFLIIKTEKPKFGSEHPNNSNSQYEVIPLFKCDPVIEGRARIPISQRAAAKLISLGLHTEYKNGYGEIYDFFGFKKEMDAEKKSRDKIISIIKSL